MATIDASMVAGVAMRLSARFGLAFEVGYLDRAGYKGWALRFLEQANDGVEFDLLLSASHHHAECIFRPGLFSGALVRILTSSWEASLAGWRSEVARLPLGLRLTVALNDEFLNVQEPAFGEPPRELEIETYTRISDQTPEAISGALDAVAESCLAMVLTGLEPHLESQDDGAIPEGSPFRAEVIRYERSPLARRRCIDAHGNVCWVCDFDFNAVYGEIGSGYVEVHHRVPVSMMGPGYLVVPERDLVPLCSNCHAMAHRRRPPYPPEDLRKAIGLAPKTQLPTIVTDREPPIDLRFVATSDGNRYLELVARADGIEWSAVVSVGELYRVLEMAEDGLQDELTVGDSAVPFRSNGVVMDVLFGPYWLGGRTEEWRKLVEDGESSAHPVNQLRAIAMPVIEGDAAELGLRDLEFT